MHTHTHTLSLTHTLTHTHTYSHTHTLSLSLTHTLTHTHSHSHTLTHTHTLSLTCKHSPRPRSPYRLTHQCSTFSSQPARPHPHHPHLMPSSPPPPPSLSPPPPTRCRRCSPMGSTASASPSTSKCSRKRAVTRSAPLCLTAKLVAIMQSLLYCDPDAASFSLLCSVWGSSPVYHRDHFISSCNNGYTSSPF